MSPQLETAAKPLVPTTINLERYGRAEVTLRAPVSDTESFYFTVPKTSMQVVVDSLEVHDTRGNRPRVSFQSPILTNIKPLVLKKTSAWKDLLMRHQGAHVELHTTSGPVEGYFLGFEKDADAYYKPAVVLLCNGNVCVHKLDSISAVAFKGVQVGKKLERYTSTMCRIQEGDSVYRIDITASGVGSGEVCVSYAVLSPFYPTFDFSYTIHADEDVNANSNDKTANGARSACPKVRVRCYAVIRNPLHYDVDDVHFTLHTGHYRYYSSTDTYHRMDKQTDDQSQSSSSSSSVTRGRGPARDRSPIRSRSPSPTARSPVRSPVPSPPPKSATYGSKSDTESDIASDVESVSSHSTTSMDASRNDRSREWDVPDKISIKEGESAKVLLYETQMGGGIVHRYDGFSARRSLTLRNTTDSMFEPGLAMFFSKGLSVKLPLTSLKPGRDMYCDFRPSGCAVKKTKSSRRGEVLCSRIVGKNLVAKVVWQHRTKYLLHNKEDEQIDVSIDHEGREKTGREVEVIARLYPEASRTGDEEDENIGTKLNPCSEGFINWISYQIEMAPKQRCAVVVSETEEKLETYEILNCSKQAIARLEDRKVVGTELAEKLRRLAELKRDNERLNRTGKLHRKRLDCIKRYERGMAQAKISSEAEYGDDANKGFFGAISAAEKSMAEIEEELDKIECEAVKLKGRMKSMKEEICEMKGVKLGSEVKEGS